MPPIHSLALVALLTFQLPSATLATPPTAAPLATPPPAARPTPRGSNPYYSQRNLILSTDFVRPVAELSFAQSDADAPVETALSLAFEWGVHRHLMLAIRAPSLTLAPDPAYESTRLTARVLLHRDVSQVALEAAFSLSASPDTRPHTLALALPLRFFTSSVSRLDLRPGATLAFPASGPVTVDPNLAVIATVNFNQPLFAELTLAAAAPRARFAATRLRVELKFGFSFLNPHGRAQADLYLDAGLGRLVDFARDPVTLSAFPWQVGLGGRVYIDTL